VQCSGAAAPQAFGPVFSLAGQVGSTARHLSESEVMESDTTVVYCEDRPANQELNTSRNLQNGVSSVFAAGIDSSENKEIVFQEETGGSSAATVPDTPPSSPLIMGSPLMFDVHCAESGAYDLQEADVAQIGNLQSDSSTKLCERGSLEKANVSDTRTSGENKSVEQRVAAQSKVSEIDAQNSFVKELLEENDVGQEFSNTEEVSHSKSCGGEKETIPLSEVATIKGLNDSDEAAKMELPLPVAGNTPSRGGRLNLNTRRKRNTRQTANRRTTRSSAKAAVKDKSLSCLQLH